MSCTIDRSVFESIGNPYIVHRWTALSFPHSSSDLAALEDWKFVLIQCDTLANGEAKTIARLIHRSLARLEIESKVRIIVHFIITVIEFNFFFDQVVAVIADNCETMQAKNGVIALLEKKLQRPLQHWGCYAHIIDL